MDFSNYTQMELAEFTFKKDSGFVSSMALNHIHDEDILKLVAVRAHRWQNRLKAVSKINDEAAIRELALIDNPRFRYQALLKLNDMELFRQEAKNSPRAENRLFSIDNLDDVDLLAEIALTDHVLNVRRRALGRIMIIDSSSPYLIRQDEVLKIKSQEKLVKIAKKAVFWKSRCQAIDGIEDKAVLLDILETDCEGFAKDRAASKLDEETLIGLVKNHDDWKVRLYAVKHIENQSFLHNLRDCNGNVCDMAYKRIGELKKNIDKNRL